MTSEPVNIAELKDHLSEYIAKVESGHSLTLCRRNKLIAKIQPVQSSCAPSALGEVKGWLDDNTKGGMTLMRLANFLSKRPSFRMVRRERKIGSTETESFWTMPDAKKTITIEDEDGNETIQEVLVMPGPLNQEKPRKGWVLDWPAC